VDLSLTKRVSVIIPNFNREVLIAETINNLLAQTCPPHEIIVVDDGSTDGSVEVVRSFGGRVTLLQQSTLCDVDVSELNTLNLGHAPAGLVPEAPLAGAADRVVAMQLGNSPVEPYFNAGVILVSVAEWRQQRVTERAMEYLTSHYANYWDQSALNVVLHGNAKSLDEHFNCIANMRKHWPALKQSYGQSGRLVHFLDYPKPWDFLGEFVHPQYRLWRSVLNKTAMKDFRSWHATPSRKFPKTSRAWTGYKKALKDRILFAGYRSGWFRNVKGMPQSKS
jgi:lipopolysaccharide biosynthesis glycosyltransferase